MFQIPTLYTNYQELLLDLDILGKILSESAINKDELKTLLFEEYKITHPLPTLEDKRYELSDLVSSDYHISYANEVELAENEQLVNLGLSDSADDFELEGNIVVPEVLREHCSYGNVTDAIREELIKEFLSEDIEEFTQEDTDSVEAVFNTVENHASTYIEGYDSDEDEESDDYSEDESYVEESEDESYDEDSDDSDDSEDDYGDDYSEDDSEDEGYGDDYSEDSDNDDSDDEEDSDGDDYSNDEDSEDENYSYDDEEDSDDEDDAENDLEDDYSYDEDSEDDSKDEDYGDDYSEEEPEEDDNNSGDDESDDYTEDSYDEDTSFDIEFEESVPSPVVEVPTPMDIVNQNKKNSTQVVEQPKTVVNREDEPKDLREFIRKHPRCEVSFALQYFSRKEIEKYIMMGKIIKKGTKLHI